jgi:hypothetical protein
MREHIEPFYFILAGSLQNIFGTIPTIKLIQFLSIVILSIGTYLFVNRHYDKKTAIIVMFMVAMIPATSRQWGDQHRNFLAISFFPLFLYSALEDDWKHVIISGVIFGLMGLTHRMIFVFAGLTFGLFTFMKFFHLKREKDRLVKNIAIFIIAGVVSSPFLFYSLLPSTGLQSGVLLKWEEQFFNLRFVANMTGYLLLFGICSFILITNNRLEEKPINEVDYLLLTMFGFAFLLATGVFGTPFLVYERYMLLFCIVACIFSAPYLKELFSFIDASGISLARQIPIFLMVAILLYTGIIGWNYLRLMTPFITEQEMSAFHWIKENLPENSTLLIPSREHFWAEATTGMKIIPLEWYSLLLQKPQTNETLIITGNPIQTQIALVNIKEKYNVSDVYVFFTMGSDPVIPTNTMSQQIIMQKFSTWNQTMTWGNSVLFKL